METTVRGHSAPLTIGINIVGTNFISSFQVSSFPTASISHTTNIVLPTVLATISAMLIVAALRFAFVKYRARTRRRQEQLMAPGDIRINDGKGSIHK